VTASTTAAAVAAAAAAASFQDGLCNKYVCLIVVACLAIWLSYLGFSIHYQA